MARCAVQSPRPHSTVTYQFRPGFDLRQSPFFQGTGLGLFVPKKRVKLVEFDRNRAVLDMALGRVIIEPESVRFHRNGKGRGIQLVGSKDSDS